MKISNIPFYMQQYAKLFLYKHQEEKYDGRVQVFDTSLLSDNLGDEIINFYCNNIFEELNVTIENRIPTHVYPNNMEEQKIKRVIPKVITGTNILSSKLEIPTWKKPSKVYMMDNIVLMGNGWEKYSDYETLYTKVFYHKLLSKKFVHSVRDEYTRKKLLNMGIKNVLNTSCPTTWKLTSDFCKSIPKNKSKSVITTITDYNKDPQNDWKMLEILLKSYASVYVWIQGKGDYEYLKKFSKFNKLNIVNRDLESYNHILEREDVEYVGTRLHAGIHALNRRKRTLIIAIDNRAKEMGKDINLPILDREKLNLKLLNLINSERTTEIKLPTHNIQQWKNQFVKS